MAQDNSNNHMYLDPIGTPITPMDRPRGLWVQAAARLLHRPKALFGIAVILILYGGGILAPWLAPYEYNEQDLFAVRQGPSSDNLLGTDFVGRDVLSVVGGCSGQGRSSQVKLFLQNHSTYGLGATQSVYSVDHPHCAQRAIYIARSPLCRESSAPSHLRLLA